MKYTAIAQVSRQLVGLLREGLAPQLLREDAVGLCAPDNRGDFSLGVYLYNVQQSEHARISGRSNQTLFTQKYPPLVLDLFYMITPYLKSDVKFLFEEEQTLLGRVFQIINDNSLLTQEEGETVTLELCSPTLEEREKIWGSSSHLYRVSAFVSARAVIVESTRSREVARVREFVVDTRQN
ncbi:DUF4255 domain-containing protein [Angelakisella massiliensis]|uniref:DUF4255 domain-containing protein n=1 Tax=Angelakisella massiliensis TaxID=1871018 RepID=UPI0008F954AC|nr:DUF4255 domain-containing protein [Angelakisella massiliensis]